jgi:hypothetical protein
MLWASAIETDVRGVWTKLLNEFHNLHILLNITGAITRKESEMWHAQCR